MNPNYTPTLTSELTVGMNLLDVRGNVVGEITSITRTGTHGWTITHTYNGETRTTLDTGGVWRVKA
jgi:hypothetical protein